MERHINQIITKQNVEELNDINKTEESNDTKKIEEKEMDNGIRARRSIRRRKPINKLHL